ncbi:MAG: hypothetical protein RLZZ77_406 [Bacteroidota bacterium]
MKQKLLSIAFSLCATLSFSQDNLGIAGSSRAPVNTVLINPSTIVDSRAFIDINFAGASVFARNSFAYLPGGSLQFGDLANTPLPSFNRDGAPYNAYVDVMAHGPSFTFAVKQHAFGVYTGVRTVADVRGIPKSLGYYITEGFQYREQMGEQQLVRDMRTNALAWGEVGVSYATILSRSGDMITQGGITVKRLIGVAGLGLRVDNWTYTVVDSTRMETARFQGEYGFTDLNTDNFSFNNGKGWGVDLGVMFKVRKKESTSYVPYSPCTDGDYRYRFGFSILDIGGIKFTGPFYRNVFNEKDQSEWSDFEGANPQDASDLDSLMTAGFGVAQSTADQSKFRMMLPMGFSAQMDYNLGHNFYVFGIITAGAPWKGRLGVQRASYLGVVPRFEIKRFEAALPISMYEFRKPQFGLMLRLNSIIIGSDNLGWLMGQNIYGADFYLSLKKTIFRHPKCRTKSPKMKQAPNRRRGPGTPVPCPAW